MNQLSYVNYRVAPRAQEVEEEWKVEAVASFGERLSLALEITQAMQYLLGQKPRVIHREMKPSNVFLDDVIRVILGTPGSWEMKSWH